MVIDAGAGAAASSSSDEATEFSDIDAGMSAAHASIGEILDEIEKAEARLLARRHNRDRGDDAEPGEAELGADDVDSILEQQEQPAERDDVEIEMEAKRSTQENWATENDDSSDRLQAPGAGRGAPPSDEE